MKNLSGLAVAIAVVLLPHVVFAQAPHQIAGFALGQNISQYEKQLIPGTAMATYEKGMMEEVEIDVPAGFKSGSLQYGMCKNPGKIIRIELKYKDSTKAFFDKLLARCKAKFGNPNEYAGDSFHVYIAWKWVFFDENKNRITLKIQHNTRDDEHRIGNVVKLTMTTLMDQERECWSKSAKKTGRKDPAKPGRADWQQLLPQ